MKAVEVTGSIDKNGNLILDEPILAEEHSNRVRVIVLFTDQEEIDPDDTPIEEVKAILRRGFQQAKAGQTRPVSELWSRIDTKS
ncbi:hypothetical protein DSM106972_035950 [Dulcicalothrix desertica PCC 7102]|uniref:Uncharacterized protein n=1 Tax=Dulcicalothrix desertica PCC 7102 TaxID=232991 RepID=A0A433VHM0_9CYAN|nr:hypothetical protein [Dulcicalothrix desertica]RUT05588.1 hypothetical protein DSM106972_035950 [Dulcicalothrix desertica PCC 7102]